MTGPLSSHTENMITQSMVDGKWYLTTKEMTYGPFESYLDVVMFINSK